MKMKHVKAITAGLMIALGSILVSSCSKDDPQPAPERQLSPAETLASTAWETTNAKNNQGSNVPLSDANVANFVGFAYFKTNGTFTMYNLDNSPKMRGDWSVPPDGKTRTIVAKNAAGETLFTRVVEITVLTKTEFTYRIYPDNSNKSVYYDIVHTPTQHPEP